MLGKHSGRAAFRNKLEQLGMAYRRECLPDASVPKDLADHKKDVTDEDIIALVDDSAGDQEAPTPSKTSRSTRSSTASRGLTYPCSTVVRCAR